MESSNEGTSCVHLLPEGIGKGEALYIQLPQNDADDQPVSSDSGVILTSPVRVPTKQSQAYNPRVFKPQRNIILTSKAYAPNEPHMLKNYVLVSKNTPERPVHRTSTTGVPVSTKLLYSFTRLISLQDGMAIFMFRSTILIYHSTTQEHEIYAIPVNFNANHILFNLT